SSGMTALACRSTRSDWSAAVLSGRRRPTGASRSARRSWLTCLTGSTGGTQFAPSFRPMQGRGRGVIALAQLIPNDLESSLLTKLFTITWCNGHQVNFEASGIGPSEVGVELAG